VLKRSAVWHLHLTPIHSDSPAGKQLAEPVFSVLTAKRAANAKPSSLSHVPSTGWLIANSNDPIIMLHFTVQTFPAISARFVSAHFCVSCRVSSQAAFCQPYGFDRGRSVPSYPEKVQLTLVGYFLHLVVMGATITVEM
jgi:hypothetical protein